MRRLTIIVAIYDDKGDCNQAIADYSQALRINSDYAPIYNNRGLAYFSKGDYTRAWEDVHKAQALGYQQIDPEFLKDLSRASGREK